MTETTRERSPGGLIRFSPEELGEMHARVADGAAPATVEGVPLPVDEEQAEATRVTPGSAVDALVDASFDRYMTQATPRGVAAARAHGDDVEEIEAVPDEAEDEDSGETLEAEPEPAEDSPPAARAASAPKPPIPTAAAGPEPVSRPNGAATPPPPAAAKAPAPPAPAPAPPRPPAPAAPAPTAPAAAVAPAAPVPVAASAPAAAHPHAARVNEEAVYSSSPPPDLAFSARPAAVGVVVGNTLPTREEELDGADLEEVPARVAAAIEAPAAPASAPAAQPNGTLSKATPPMAPVALVAGASVTPAAAPAPAPPPVPVAAGRNEATPRPGRRSRNRSWFEDFFDDDYVRTLPTLSEEQTSREANFILQSMKLEPGSAVLDVGCGTGRHAVELASRGLRVTGVDISQPLIERARTLAAEASPSPAFVQGDMREMSFDGEFDAAYCYFCTFGYFDDEGNRKAASEISRALRPGGRLLLDLLNRDHVIAQLPTRVWWEGEGCMVLEEVDFNYFTSRLQSHRSMVFEDGRQTERDLSIRAYSLHEIGNVLHQAGFRITEVSGGPSLRGRFFGGESRQMLILAEKK